MSLPRRTAAILFVLALLASLAPSGSDLSDNSCRISERPLSRRRGGTPTSSHLLPGRTYGRRASRCASRKPRSEAGSWSSRAKGTSPASVSSSARWSAGQL